MERAKDYQTPPKKAWSAQTTMAATLFCGSAASMTLLNKAALSAFQFHSPVMLLAFQCFIAVIMVLIVAFFNPKGANIKFNSEVVRVWYPVNIIFTGMIVTSFWALKDMTVPMSNVLRNMSVIFTAATEYLMYRRVYSAKVWACMGLIIISTLCSAYSDLYFNAVAYTWQLINCLIMASYNVVLKQTIDKVQDHTGDGSKLSQCSMVLLNNLLSLPLLLSVAWGNGEFFTVWNEPDIDLPSFKIVAFLSGIVGFGISFSMLWFLSLSTPTTVSLLNSLNKIPVSILGLFLFEKHWTATNLMSIIFAMISGVLFVLAKDNAWQGKK